jgi:thioredoxin 1
LNTDDNPDLAMKYNVMSIPTLLVFKGWRGRKGLVGAKSKGALQEPRNFFPQKPPFPLAPTR